jgi:undecaprenyl-diphosphatase
MNAVLSYFEQSDLRLVVRLRGWHLPAWLRLWMRAATRIGDGWYWPAVALAGLSGRVAGLRFLVAATAGVAVANISQIVLKRRFRRARPSGESSRPGLAAPEWLAFDEFSFPSGHTLNAFAAATLVGLASPAFAPLAGILAVSIGLSRVVLGFHYPSDVVAGALIGSTIGGSVFRLFVG